MIEFTSEEELRIQIFDDPREEWSVDEYLGRRVASAEIADDRLILGFDTGKTVEISDDAQHCCEERYMTTDDDLHSLVGHVLTRIEAKLGPDTDDDGEQVFVEVATDAGFITIVNHNKHNGYYGGFRLTIEERARPSAWSVEDVPNPSERPPCRICGDEGHGFGSCPNG